MLNQRNILSNKNLTKIATFVQFTIVYTISLQFQPQVLCASPFCALPKTTTTAASTMTQQTVSTNPTWLANPYNNHLGARSQECRSTSLLNSAPLLSSEGLTALFICKHKYHN